MRKITEGSIQAVRALIDLREVVKEFGSPVIRGNMTKVCCPIHTEKTPSMIVKPEYVKCFGCGWTGNGFQLMMKLKGLSFEEAVEELASRYGVTLQYEGQKTPEKPTIDLYPVLEAAAVFFRESLRTGPVGKIAREWLRSIGFTPEAANEFRIGFCNESLLDHLVKAGYKVGLIEKAGLVKKGDKGYVSTFQNHITFPVTDNRGRVTGFVGRTVGETNSPKYVLNPATDVFKPSVAMFGLHQSAASINHSRTAILVEGVMDVITLWQHGVKNVLATLGPTIRELQARNISKMADEVFVLFDGDTIGNTAMQSVEPLYKAKLYPRAVLIPKGIEPGQWIKTNGAEKIKEKMTSSPTLVESIILARSKKHDLSTKEGVAGFVGEIGKVVSLVEEPAESWLYTQLVGNLTGGIPREVVLGQ